MLFSAEFLSRIQFAFNVGFHILWPAINIGLALFLLITEAVYLKTKNKEYIAIHKFFSKIFALAFGMGVVTGLPMSFQFGTNFSTFSQAASPIIAPLLGSEILTAFFLEAVFLGVMLFGWERVSPRVHFMATLFVVIGVHNSAFWILVVNSFMHTPAGVELVDGVFKVISWKAVIFNPSFAYRFTHMILASYITAILIVSGVAAFYLFKNRSEKEFNFAKKTFSISTLVLTVLVPLQILAGDMHGLNTLKHQPAKVAAMEGNWETKKGIPLVLFAIPSQNEAVNKYEISIPKVSSLILTHHLDGEVKGLKDWAPEDRPNVPIVFFAFRIMVGLGFAYLAFILIAAYLRKKGKLFTTKPFLLLSILLAPTGYIAVLAGWMVTEVGRQPWVIYGVMRTKDAVSPSVTSGVVAWSLSCFVILYALLFACFIYYLVKFLAKGPEHIIDNTNKNLNK